MATLIQLRRDITSNWTSSNPILAQGEIGVDITANSIKVGNGVDAWNSLDYIASQAVGGIDSDWVLSQLSSAPGSVDSDWVLSQLSTAPGSVDSDWVLSQIPTAVENQVDSEWVISYVSNTPPPTSSGGDLTIDVNTSYTLQANQTTEEFTILTFNASLFSFGSGHLYIFTNDKSVPGEYFGSADVFEIAVSGFPSDPAYWSSNRANARIRWISGSYGEDSTYITTVVASISGSIVTVKLRTGNNLNYAGREWIVKGYVDMYSKPAL